MKCRLKGVREVFPSKATFVFWHKHGFSSLVLKRLQHHLHIAVKHLQIGCNKLIKQHSVLSKKMNLKFTGPHPPSDCTAFVAEKLVFNPNSTCKNRVVFLYIYIQYTRYIWEHQPFPSLRFNICLCHKSEVKWSQIAESFCLACYLYMLMISITITCQSLSLLETTYFLQNEMANMSKSKSPCCLSTCAGIHSHFECIKKIPKSYKVELQ